MEVQATLGLIKDNSTGKVIIPYTGSSGGGSGMPIGTIFSHTCSAGFVPENSLPCDGTEYTQAQFPTLYTGYLVGGKLNTCTYEEYAQEIATYSKCAKFGLDTTNGKFKVPTIPDGTFIQQAMTDGELGESYNAGLPNITGGFRRKTYSNDTGATNMSGAFTFPSGGIFDKGVTPSGANKDANGSVYFDASLSNSIYGSSATVQPNAVALRFFVIVATGSVNESQMNWSEWASSLQGKANTDLNNLSNNGKKVIDGQWVAKTSILLNESTTTGDFDLSSYLPNDGYQYEVMFTSLVQATTSAGQQSYICSDVVIENLILGYVSTGTTTTNSVIVSLPVGTSRKVTITGTSKKTICATAYRRIGTNS